MADRQNNRIQVFDSTGVFLKVLKNNESVAQLPSLTIDNSQNLFAVDYDFSATSDTFEKGSTVFKYGGGDSIVFRFGASGDSTRTPCWFHDIAVDKQGNIYVGDISRIKVLKFKIKTIDKSKE